METLSFDVPKMYGDHHVTEVRRILSGMPGVEEVNASSSFHIVEVRYDPAVLTANTVKTTLEEAGYLGTLTVPVEEGVAAYGNDNVHRHLRHSAAYAQVNRVVSFAQDVAYAGQPLWPCPGLGVIRQMGAEEDE